MNKKRLLSIVFSCILGSAMVSGTESLSYTFKSIFYSFSMFVLLMIGLFGLVTYFKEKEGKA